MKDRRRAALLLVALLASLAGCSTVPQSPMRTVEYVDLDRFMGRWYVIASIPTFLEAGAHNAVEEYTLAPDGTVATVFTFRKDAFDGPEKRYTPRGFVEDRRTNAVWGMRFLWPIKAEYRIVYLDEAYSLTVIGRSRRDYAWIMARTPEIDAVRYARMIELLAELDYDTAAVSRVPQRWD